MVIANVRKTQSTKNTGCYRADHADCHDARLQSNLFRLHVFLPDSYRKSTNAQIPSPESALQPSL